MPIDHDRLTELFTEAMDLPEIEQRRLVERVRVVDDELATELASMLAADDKIVTGLRTAGLRPDDASAGVRMRTMPFQVIQIPGYRVKGLLGKGGMGVVYAADQLEPARAVAIKVLHMASPEALARFGSEAAIMLELDHPGIARVLASGEANGNAYIVMERIKGTTLDAFAGDLRSRIELMAQVCDAVDHAHAKGVVHRDLKPRNIMVREGGGVAIFDFGVARIATSNRTAKGDFLGTLTYMSPEQALGRQIDAGADIYALGIILHELVRGGPPYDLANLNTAQAVRLIVNQPPRALESGDAELDAIVARALAKTRAERQASAAELGAQLRSYLLR